MRVQAIMSTNVATVPATATAQSAFDRMQKRGIHHLVVVDGQRAAVGILSQRDLGTARNSKLRKGRTVAQLMRGPVVTIPRTASVRQAAKRMEGHGIGCLPVSDPVKKGIVGIITVTDLLHWIARGGMPEHESD